MWIYIKTIVKIYMGFKLFLYPQYDEKNSVKYIWIYN